ncbi:MAG: bis(5'-nucleosyl)-tetraphosphatase (symmetrical) YqeK [Christensenellales bacterium]|jgi:predicted HD superfamily hydrolase involved in NAD metabolism
MNRIERLEKLRATLEERRLLHTLGVERTAQALARRWGCDEEKAALAGLLHDCAKDILPELAMEKARELGFAFDAYECFEPKLMHAPLGAALARQEYGVCDDEVLSAIKFHTTGRKNMILLEKIVYMADFIEPGRVFYGVEELRELAWTDLDEALLFGLRQEICSVVERGGIVHPDSIQAMNWLVMSAK